MHARTRLTMQRTFANLDEDVETEDAWEIASRRASVLSRKASNHSLRIPSSDALAAEPVPPLPVNDASASAAAPAVAGAGTEINAGTGAVSVSVEDLLSHPGQEIEGLSLHDRSATVVGPAPASALAPETETDTRRISTGDNSGTDVPPEETAAIPIGSSLPGQGQHQNQFATSFSQAATPMNDTFLSTLAPSVHQRLDLADQLDSSSQGHGSGSGIPETLEEVEESEQDSDRNRERDGDQQRRDSGPETMIFD